MTRFFQLFAVGGLAFCLTAQLALAHKAGPDPRHTGAPGDDPQACATSGCHTGTALNAGGGSVAVTFPNGNVYTPGQQQTLTVTVADPKLKFSGFQMSARLATDPANGQAGDFTAQAAQLVLCDDGSSKGSKGCAANVSIQFVEHSVPSTTGIWQVTWTGPATNVGDVIIYVAGNSNTQMSTPDGSHIYTAKFTLSAGGGVKPSVSQAGIVSASAFNPKAGVASGTWLEIFGSNISPSTRGWGGADFVGSQAPTSLDGVKVSVNGKNAYVDFISPSQVNVQVPDDAAIGPVQIIVTNRDGSSDPVTVDKAALAPALLAPGAWDVGGKQYVVAQLSDGSFVAKTNLIAGLKFRPAKAGEIVTIYGIGFGPVNPGTPAGTVASGTTALQNKATFLFGQTAGDLACTGCYAGLAPGAVGLYQFNVKIPNGPSGDVALTVDAGGVSTKQTLFITLQ